MENEAPVSHVDLYHKLGKLEGLMETMMNSVSSFQMSIKDVHSRIDAVEARQTMLENKQSSNSGASSALSVLAKDFMIPVIAIIITWFIAKETDIQAGKNKNSTQNYNIESNRAGTLLLSDKK